MSAHFLELKLDRNLLDHNFEGYKLSLVPNNSTKYEFDSPVKRVLIDPNHYSYLHAKVFGLHNFLFGETTNTYENVYFIDKEEHLKKASLNPYSKELDVCDVWSLPTHGEVPNSCNSGQYNVSLKLVSENLAVLSDGVGTFFILDTGDRSTDAGWKLVYTEKLLQSRSFYIQDAVLKDTELHVILCRIEQGDKKAQLAIHWVTFIDQNNTWEKLSSRELLVKGDTSYLYLERTCEAIYVASSVGCKFVFDSKNSVIKDSEEIEIIEERNSYKWSQDSDNVVVHFIMPEDIKKEDMVVTCGSINIKVEYMGRSILNGALFGKVDSDLTIVTLSKHLLEIILIKEEQGSTWSTLLRYDKNEDMPSDEFYIGREIKEKLDHLTCDKQDDPPQGITFNTEQVEECDFSNGEFTVFERLCVHSHKVTHKYNFGSNQVLLTVQTNKALPPSFGIRHDVDVCLWEPHFDNGNFELKHVATLLAFGYIQASKQQKKYITCPPDTSFAVICETSRHIFLYRQKRIVTSGELKNRKSGARIESVSEQKVVSIPNEEIFGVYVSQTAIYVLGEHFLMRIKS